MLEASNNRTAVKKGLKMMIFGPEEVPTTIFNKDTKNHVDPLAKIAKHAKGKGK